MVWTTFKQTVNFYGLGVWALLMLQGSGQCSPARPCYSNPGARLWARGALDNEQTWFDGLMDCHYHFLNPNPGDVRYQYADITSNQVQRVEVAAPVVIEAI